MDSRIEIRLDKELKEYFIRASKIKGFKNLSEFIIYQLKEASDKIIKEENEILKTIRDKEKFVEALVNPPEPNEALKEAWRDYKTDFDGPQDRIAKKTP